MLGELVRGLGVTLRHIFRPRVTVEYPEKRRPLPARVHGRHVLNRWPDGLEKCVGCELCAWVCPADAIFVEAGENTPEARYSPGERYARRYEINYLRCIFCGLCVEACPTRALTMTAETRLSVATREDAIYTKEMLLVPLPDGLPPVPRRDEGPAGDYYEYYRSYVRGFQAVPVGLPVAAAGGVEVLQAGGSTSEGAEAHEGSGQEVS